MTVPGLSLPEPYETFLLEHGEHLHAKVQDMLNCRLDAIRATSVKDIEPILNLFKGPSLAQKKALFVEFLRIMPEYKTTDKELLYKRLKALKDYIKVKDGTSDLYYWAMKRYRASANESDT